MSALQQNQAEQERKNFQSSSNIDIDYYVENYDLSSVEYNRIHAVRFYYSYCWIEEYLKENSKIVELGAPGLFSYIIKDLHKSVEVTNTTKDLRYEFDVSSNEFDLILNMEVIEHIKDREPTDSQDFHEVSLFSMTGLKSFISECNRVLKPDGLMLLTTPNMNSLQNIHRILNYLAPMNYYPHVREYTIGELVNWVKEHGFDILKIATYDVYGDYKQGGRAEMRALLDRIGVSNEYRGDNIFMLLKKVNPQTGKGDETIAEPLQSETGNLKDINFIIFPDWSQSEESICLELERVIRMLANHPDKSRINLIVDTSNIYDEDANLLLTSVTMNLMMQEDLDVTDGPEISLVGSLNKIKWSELLPSLHSRIILENENKRAIAQVGAEKITSLTLETLINQPNIELATQTVASQQSSVVQASSGVTLHKRRERQTAAKVSVILIDWSCRESFHTLDWLDQQTIPRDEYELIWIELYDRVIPEAMEKADVVITCGQQGLYHKHEAYNVGILHASGEIITISDSDAVYPPQFIASIISQFCRGISPNEVSSIVLMHYELRSQVTYPKELSRIEDVTQYPWMDPWPNVGACMSVRKIDAIRFGGFDEHDSFRGNLCGPYDLGWRLVNAGLVEIWHDLSVCLFHFAHPHSNARQNEPGWNEIKYPHVEYHALTAVEAFSTGRMLPLQENPEVHKLRMSMRRIGTKYEEKYAWMESAILDELNKEQVKSFD